MPMPPPKPTSEPLTPRRRLREIAQIERALAEIEPADEQQLAARVGAAYWDRGRFDRALRAGLELHRLRRDAEGRWSVGL